MTSKQILTELDGCEIKTRHLETEFGVVGVREGKVYEGEKVFKLSAKQLRDLWNDYTYQEGITDTRGNILNEVEREFTEGISEEAVQAGHIYYPEDDKE